MRIVPASAFVMTSTPAHAETVNLYAADSQSWACLVAPGIVLDKDGSFQRTLLYRGPDLDSATEAELVSVTARLNSVLG
jgi:type IV secretory pathway VirB4 component